MNPNLYLDTRGKATGKATFTEAVVRGLAPGGGLYVPERIPQLTMDRIVSLADMPYARRAAAVYRAFEVDLPEDQVDRLMEQAYGSNFDTPEICPVSTLSATTHVLELWHGPTSAFKDMALQCLPRFFSASVAKLHAEGRIDHDFLILVATSGDTGKAALEGFRDVEHTAVGVLFPDGGVSDIQRKQMVTQRGANVKVWGVRGNFDDCQTGVKAVFSDEAFASELMASSKMALSSANSINWGRLMPQIVYYLSAYAQLVSQGKVPAGDPIDVCVPTGNFGNILAAYYAKRMGCPIEMLYCASNENRVLTDFINTGTYDIADREFVLTPSPSMDILVSSNLERQLFEITGRDCAAIDGWMEDLRGKRRFRVDERTFSRLREAYRADSIDNATCLETIKQVHDEHGYLLDPHTAVAWKAGENLRGANPLLVVSTAHWAKFGADVYRALNGIAPGEELPAEIAALTGCQLDKLIAEKTGSAVPSGLAELDDIPVRFTDVIDGTVDGIEQATLDFSSDLRGRA